MSFKRGNREYTIAMGGFVYDGDTFQAIKRDGSKLTVRIYGIDAPEKTQFGAGHSKELLTRLVKNEKIQLCEISKDKYGRSVCVVHRFRDDGDVGLVMLNRGMAKASVRSGLYANKYNNTAVRASSSGIGLWKAGSLFSDPSKFRENKKTSNRFNTFSEADNYDRKEMERLNKLYRNMKTKENSSSNVNKIDVSNESKSGLTSRSITDFLDRVKNKLDFPSRKKEKVESEKMVKTLVDRINRNM